MKFITFTILCIFVGVFTWHRTDASSQSPADEGVEEPIITPKTVRRLGEDPCTSGPRYFCQNAARMSECNREEYCNRRSSSTTARPFWKFW